MALPEQPADAILIGECASFRRLRERLQHIARAERTTLLSGPTGAGKDVVARTLHAQSSRSDRPYVTVHCAALPEPLLEAEMFGHSRGAFTGATQARPGLVRSARNGTLFLDEIDSLPAGAQAKLLRFLETGEYRAVGSDRVEHSTAWVLAATNRDLVERVRAGAFRADLFFRLAVVEVKVPSLRERPEDIYPLAQHFLDQTTRSAKSFDEAARRALESYTWPGNVRELRHRVEAAALFSEGSVITAASLNLDPEESESAEAPNGVGDLEEDLWELIEARGLSLPEAIDKCEHVLVRAALRAESNNRTRAAARLRIHVRTIFKKLER